MISLRNVTFSYLAEPVFDDISFTIPSGYKVGLAGPNGAGKSTLLRIISGEYSSDKGKVELLGTIAWVPQEVKRDPEIDQALSIRDYIDSGKLMQDYQIKEALKGLEMGHLDLDQAPRDMSGGQKTKLALARALLSEHPILLLDEPTNYLDVAGKKWVMNFISKTDKTVLVISHDLELLDRSIDKMLWLNTHTKKIDEYTGNYSAFLRQREEADRLLKKTIQVESQRIKGWEEGLKKGTFSVKQRIQMQRRVERAKDKLPELPPELKKMRFALPPPPRGSEIPIKASHISKAYDDFKVFDDVNFYLERGERLAIIGQNGAGKSTLIKILVGVLQADSGEVLIDSSTKLGYYSQEHELFDLDKNPLLMIRELTQLPDGLIRAMLGNFLITGEKIFQPIHTLSGGEKTRLALALLLLQNNNLLILDEPTTYLDVTSQRVLLEALKSYQGTLIIVSHTEDFIRELEPSKGLLLPENHFDIWDEDKMLPKVADL